MATVTIDIENRSFVKQGTGPIRSAVDVSLERGISTAGVFDFTMPASDPNAAELSNKLSVLRFYVDTTVVFLGVVESMRRRVGSDGVVWLDVTGRDLLGAEFGEALAGIDDLVGGGGGPTYIAPYLVRPSSWAMIYYNSGWATYSTGNLTTAGIYGKMWGESALTGFIKMADQTNEQWAYYPETDGDRKVRWIGTRWDDSGVRAIQGAGEPVQAEGNANICFIQSLSKVSEAHELVNRITVYGAGNANARLTLAAATSTPTGYTMSTTASTLYNNASYSAFSLFFDKRLEFKEIGPLSNTDADLQAAANYLAEAGAAWLDRHATEQIYYELTVAKLPAAVKPGTQIRIVYADDSLDVDALFNVLGVATGISRDGTILYRLQVSDTSKWMLTGPGVIASTVERGEIYIAHPQMNANVDTYSYGGVSFSDTDDAELFFVLSNAIVQINQVMMYYRVDPLRSEVDTAASSSDTGSGHTHEINLADSTTGSAVYFAGTGTPPVGDFRTSGGGTVNTSSTGSSHTHTITTGLTYGIFEDSGGTVEATTGVTLAVNAGAPTNSPAAVSGGWYKIDLTPNLASTTTFRPTAETNTVTVTASSGKRGRVTAHIEIRSIIQAIAYS